SSVARRPGRGRDAGLGPAPPGGARRAGGPAAAMIDPMPESESLSLAPSLLLSMPQLADPNFTRTVVLLCQHDANGAFGLVLNRPVTMTARIVPQGRPEAATERDVEVWIGGPVEPERNWILISDPGLDAQAVKVAEGVYLSTSLQVLEMLLESPDH